LFEISFFFLTFKKFNCFCLKFHLFCLKFHFFLEIQQISFLFYKFNFSFFSWNSRNFIFFLTFKKFNCFCLKFQFPFCFVEIQEISFFCSKFHVFSWNFQESIFSQVSFYFITLTLVYFYYARFVYGDSHKQALPIFLSYLFMIVSSLTPLLVNSLRALNWCSDIGKPVRPFYCPTFNFHPFSRRLLYKIWLLNYF